MRGSPLGVMLKRGDKMPSSQVQGPGQTKSGGSHTE